MAIGTDAIEVFQGADVALVFTMDPVVNVSGWTTLFSLRDGDTHAFNKAGTVSDGPSGEITVTLADTELEALSIRAYNYDLWRTDAGAETILASGTFTVRKPARDVA